jgi:hypothetical protein
MATSALLAGRALRSGEQRSDISIVTGFSRASIAVVACDVTDEMILKRSFNQRLMRARERAHWQTRKKRARTWLIRHMGRALSADETTHRRVAAVVNRLSTGSCCLPSPIRN